MSGEDGFNEIERAMRHAASTQAKKETVEIRAVANGWVVQPIGKPESEQILFVDECGMRGFDRMVDWLRLNFVGVPF